ncbi:Secreted and surface protein containing fasciclin-like repeats [Methanosarcina barkeri str. Wiesmoor]|uniref:Secreted and surface protein containing fasciclin-like repeats n=2 Tax=Methanosarcina barkeri TaxID=2208 RepID=A0A0E3QL98_METBA|nr:fasciclin domain-containing protein [Methanosarcina barkeri]AKB50988.1 Secreted and surface protein containing fasciclin-like repeats [Methanosarcina barkeri str. Wiesmoor]
MGEESAIPTEGATPNVTEQVDESVGRDIGEGSLSGQEDTSLAEGKEVIIPGEENSSQGITDEENSGQGNETSSENQASDKNQTIIQTAEEAGYTTFASLARDAGLEDTLNEGGPYTVFAPTDIAFENLPEGMLDDLRNDKERLNLVLVYHVINGEYRATDLKNINSLASFLKTEKLAVNTTTDGMIMVGDATVIESDIIAGNGVIHGIDKVLIPL